MRSPLRSTMSFACRRTLLRAAAPTAIALALATIGAHALPPQVAVDAAAASILWLQLPPFVATVTACAAAVEFWPTLSRERPGVDFVRRATIGPLHGGLAAAAGALTALLLLLLATALLLGTALPTPHAHRAVAPTGNALLDTDDGSIEFALDGAPCSELQLRPVALLPQATPTPTSLQLLADGEPLLTAPVDIVATRQLVRVPTAGRALRRVTVQRTGGNLPLLFPADALVAVDARAESRMVGSAAAFALYLLPAAVALAFALLLAPFVALPVGLVVVTAALLVQLFGTVGPATAAVAAAARGHWIAAEPVFRGCLPSLGTGLAAMIAAMLTRAGCRR